MRSRVWPQVLVVALAVASWSALGLLVVDALGPVAGRASSAVVVDEDPCALTDPLPVGSDTRCNFDLATAEGRSLLVDLDQRWQGNTLVQWLNVRSRSVPDALHFVYAQTTGLTPSRVVRLFTIRAPDGGEQLVYLLGRCGAVTCPASDLVVIEDDGGKMRTVLSLRLGALGDVHVRGGTLTAFEAWFPQGAQRPGGTISRAFGWDGKAYTLRELTMLPAPTPTPTPR